MSGSLNFPQSGPSDPRDRAPAPGETVLTLENIFDHMTLQGMEIASRPYLVDVIRKHSLGVAQHGMPEVSSRLLSFLEDRRRMLVTDYARAANLKRDGALVVSDPFLIEDGGIGWQIIVRLKDPDGEYRPVLIDPAVIGSRDHDEAGGCYVERFHRGSAAVAFKCELTSDGGKKQSEYFQLDPSALGVAVENFRGSVASPGNRFSCLRYMSEAAIDEYMASLDETDHQIYGLQDIYEHPQIVVAKPIASRCQPSSGIYDIGVFAVVDKAENPRTGGQEDRVVMFEQRFELDKASMADCVILKPPHRPIFVSDFMTEKVKSN